MLIIVLPVLLAYVGFILWFIGRRYLPRYYARVSGAGGSASPYRLAGMVRRILSLAHFLFFFAVIIWPPIYLIMTMSQTGQSGWGADIGVFSGFKFDLSLLPNLEASGLREQVFGGKTLLNIDTSNGFAWHLFAVSTYMKALISFYVVLQLRNIFVSLGNGEVFTRINTTRVKKIALAILASQLAAPLLQYFGWGAVLKDISFNTQAIQLYPAYELNLLGIFTGLALLVLSGVINEAVQMRDEQRLTI